MAFGFHFLFLFTACFIFHAESFVLQNRQPEKLNNEKRGATKLVQALKSMDSQRRKRGQNSDFNNDDFESQNTLLKFLQNKFYDQPNLNTDSSAYNWNLPQDGNYDYYAYHGNGDNSNGKNYYDDSYEYGDQGMSNAFPEVSAEELTDIMNGEPIEQESLENASDSVSSANEELEDIFSDESDEARQKKTADWAPKVLGMTGLKRSGGAVVQHDGTLQELSDQEIEQLLSSAKDAEVKTVGKQIEITNNNGKQEVSAKEIEDILTDEDGDGKPEEIFVEHDIPVKQAQKEVRDTMAKGSDNFKQAETDLKQHIENMEADMDDIDMQNIAEMEALTREVFNQYQDEREDDDISVKNKRSNVDYYNDVDTRDLAKQCLLRYIMLEDSENTELSEALDLATRAQYEGNDKYIPAQVDYLRKAVLREQLLQKIQEQCLQLLGVNVPDIDTPDMSEYDPMVGVGRPMKRGGKSIPEFNNDYREYGDDNDAMAELLENGLAEPNDPARTQEERVLIEALQDAYEEYLANELKTYLADQKQRESISYMSRDMSDAMQRDMWYDVPVEDEDDTEWMLNPFLREIIQKYQRSDLQGENVDNSVDLPEYAPSLEDIYETNFIDEGICAAIDDMTDNCAYAMAFGWSLDEDAMALCNRHQLCYACGEAHGLSAAMCDMGYQAEAYDACAAEADELSCIDEADSLYQLMSRVHNPVDNTRLECESQCVADYISGESFKK